MEGQTNINTCRVSEMKILIKSIFEFLRLDYRDASKNCNTLFKGKSKLH